MRSPKLSLFCFIDALGWSLVQRYGFLDDILKHRQPLGTILGYSCTCDPTILTGLKPSDHGHFSFFYYEPQKSPFRWMPLLQILPKSLTNRGRVRHWISKIIKWFYGFTGYFQLYSMPFNLLPYFNYSEQRDIYAPGGINSGAPTIFEHLRQQNIPYYLSEWWKSEEYNLDLLRKSMKSDPRPRMGYLYMAAMDAILHADGNESPRVEQKIRWYEHQLRLLLDEAHSLYDQVDIYVFSDHGMTDVTQLSPLRTRIEALPLKFGEDYAAVYDSTLARFWFLKPTARQPILDILAQEPLGKILSDQELEGYGCLFPDYRYGELMFLMNPGVLLCPSHLGEKPLKGMHGYAPQDRDSWAALLSNVAPSIPVPDLTSLYNLMKKESQ